MQQFHKVPSGCFTAAHKGAAGASIFQLRRDDQILWYRLTLHAKWLRATKADKKLTILLSQVALSSPQTRRCNLTEPWTS